MTCLVFINYITEYFDWLGVQPVLAESSHQFHWYLGFENQWVLSDCKSPALYLFAFSNLQTDGDVSSQKRD